MSQFIFGLLGNKQLFTYVIISLYVMQSLFQFTIQKDFTWGWYWFAALQITICAMMLSQR